MIDAAFQDVEDTLREELYYFRARLGTLYLAEESLGPRSKRPGRVTAWMVMSDARDPKNPETKQLFVSVREELLVQAPPLTGGLAGVARC